MERALLSIEWLQKARIDRHWTQEEVAEQMRVDVSTVRRWEHGRNKPQPRQYYHLCQLFHKALPDGFQVDPAGEADKQVASKEERQLLQESDPYTQFLVSDLTVRLLRILWTWPLRNENARYHELQSLLIQEIEQKDNTMHHPINRRDALRRIAGLPIEVYGLSLALPAVLREPDAFLPQCAAGIASCWYLRKGKDLAFVSSVVSRYAPTLKDLVTQGPGTFRKDAADILAQCLILKARCVIYFCSLLPAPLTYLPFICPLSSSFHLCKCSVVF